MAFVPSIAFLRLNPKKNQDIPLPCYMTAQSAGMDICAALEENVTLEPGRVVSHSDRVSQWRYPVDSKPRFGPEAALR
jgi:dUTPase